CDIGFLTWCASSVCLWVFDFDPGSRRTCLIVTFVTAAVSNFSNMFGRSPSLGCALVADPRNPVPLWLGGRHFIFAPGEAREGRLALQAGARLVDCRFYWCGALPGFASFLFQTKAAWLALPCPG